jgi:hypothetical protein
MCREGNSIISMNPNSLLGDVPYQTLKEIAEQRLRPGEFNLIIKRIAQNRKAFRNSDYVVDFTKKGFNKKRKISVPDYFMF